MNEKNEKLVLVVDKAADSDEFKALIDAGFTVETVGSLAEFADKLVSRTYSQVLIDYASLVLYESQKTELQKQLDILAESEVMYRNLIERSNDGVVVLQDRLIKYVNPRFCEMSGYSSDILLNTIFIKYLTPEEIVWALERYEQRLAGKPIPPIYETVMTRSDGSKIPLEVSAAIAIFEGRPADLVLVRDITERRKAEEICRSIESSLKMLAI